MAMRVTLTALRLAACGAVLFASLAAACAATPSDMVEALTRIDLGASTPREVAAALAPLGLPTPVCGEEGPGAKPGRPSVGVFMFLPLPAQCDKTGEVVGLNAGPVNLPASATARLAAALAPGFGPPCFNGLMPVDGRRRAPALFMTAWLHGTRVLALTRASASAVQASVAYAELAPRTEERGTEERGTDIVDLFRRTLPPSCGVKPDR